MGASPYSFYMKAPKGWILAALIGTVVAILVVSALVLTSGGQPTSVPATPIAHVFWMHTLTSTSSGNARLYNVTLTINQTIPVADLLFLLFNKSGAVVNPPTFSLTLMNVTLPVAIYNLTSQNWSSGGSGSIVGGEWLQVRTLGLNLAGYKMAAIGGGPFSSTSNVWFP